MKPFAIVLLTLAMLTYGCGKRCTDPNAMNELEKGDCVYAVDRHVGTYDVTCNCVGANSLSPNFNRTFSLQITKADENNILINNLMGCTGQANSLVVKADPNHYGFSVNAACDSANYTGIGEVFYTESNRNIALTFSFVSVSAFKSYNCTGTGVKK